MTPLLPALFTAIALAMACVTLHYEALRLISSILPSLAIAPRPKILVVIAAVLLAHIVEVGFYAAAYWQFLANGHDKSCAAATPAEFAVFISFESYASLGTSICPPSGPLRLLAGTEALIGLILIGWTASYTYLAMQELWGEH